MATQRTTGKTFWDVLENLFTGKPLIVWLTIVGLIITIVLLMVFQILHVEIKESKLSMSFNQIKHESIQNDSLISFCVTKGNELKKKYIIKTIIQSYHFDRVSNDSLIVRERITYDLLALENIKKAQNVFKEQYSSNFAKVERWYGNQDEQIMHMGNQSEYYLHFDCKKGKSITLITGADFYYKLPLDNNRASPFRKYILNSNEDLWIYPNDEDVIGKLTMIIYSKNIKFISQTNSALHTIGGSVNDDSDYFYNHDENFKNPNNSISKTWEKILPDEQFALKVKW